MEYIKDNIPKGSKRPGYPMVAQYLTLHSTANPNSTAKNERAWLTNPTNTRIASWHIVSDEKEAIEAVPLNEVAWHAGDANGTGNRGSIGIEICESGNREKTLANAVEMTVRLLKERKWGVDKLRRHFDWSGKICPRIMSANGWQGWAKFKAEVEQKLIPAINIIINGRRADRLTARLLNGRTEVLVSGQWIALRDMVNLIPAATLRWDVTTQTAEVRIP
jgi:N-acetylmuramoyl-L-alanine amidase